MLAVMWGLIGAGYMIVGMMDALNQGQTNPVWYCAGILAFILAELKDRKR